MNTIILDDNTLFAKQLYHHLSINFAKRNWEFHCTLFSSPSELLEKDLSLIQVAFLDIDMPNINGLEVAQQLRNRYPEIILIFVTAYLQYAPSGYKVNALRYLLKNQYVEEIEPCLDAIEEKLFESKDTIIIEQRDMSLEIAVKDILYFEGTPRRCVLIHTLTPISRTNECLGKLGDHENRLIKHGFLRLHKSFLVNMYYIDKISNHIAHLKNGEKINVSTINYKQICSQYLFWRGRYL